MRKNKAFIGFILLAAMMLSTALSYADQTGAPPPVQKKKKLKWLQDLSAKADSGSNQSATVAGVRGLEEVGAPPDTSARDFKAIDRLDAVAINADELKIFIAEGKLR